MGHQCYCTILLWSTPQHGIAYPRFADVSQWPRPSFPPTHSASPLSFPLLLAINHRCHPLEHGCKPLPSPSDWLIYLLTQWKAEEEKTLFGSPSSLILLTDWSDWLTASQFVTPAPSPHFSISPHHERLISMVPKEDLDLFNKLTAFSSTGRSKCEMEKRNLNERLRGDNNKINMAHRIWYGWGT